MNMQTEERSILTNKDIQDFIHTQQDEDEEMEMLNFIHKLIRKPKLKTWFRITFLIFYNFMAFLYILIGADRYLKEFIFFGILGILVELLYGIWIFSRIKAKSKLMQTITNEKIQEPPKNRNKEPNQMQLNYIYDPSWIVFQKICKNLCIVYKVCLLVFYNIGVVLLFIHAKGIDRGWYKSYYPSSGFLGTIALIVEGFIIFFGYIRKDLYSISLSILNNMLVIGTYMTLIITLLINLFDFTQRSPRYIILCLFGILVVSVVIFGLNNRFTASFVLSPNIPVEHKKKSTSPQSLKHRQEDLDQQSQEIIKSGYPGEFQYLKEKILPSKSPNRTKSKFACFLWTFLKICALIFINIIFFAMVTYDLWFIGIPGYIAEFLLFYFNKNFRKKVAVKKTRFWLRRCLKLGIWADRYESVNSFSRARRMFRRSIRAYNHALKLTPEMIEMEHISKIILLLKKKIGYNYLSAGLFYSSKAFTNYSAKQNKRAIANYRNANQWIEYGIKYLEKQERKIFDFGFTVDISLLYDILKLFQIIIPQIELEVKYQKKTDIYQNNMDLQEIFEKIKHASQELTKSVAIYNQSYLLEEKYYEKHELVSLFNDKFTQAVYTFENLHDRITFLLQYLQNLEDQGGDMEKVANVMKLDINPKTTFSETTVEASANSTPKSKANSSTERVALQKEQISPAAAIKIIREYEYLGGKIRLKIGLVNTTGKVITNLALRFDLPNSLKWIIHEPDYIRRGDTILIPKLGGDEKIAISLYLEPLNCMKSAINATLTFFDANDHPQAVIMPPKKVSITCPIFFTREEANLARVRSIQKKLKYADKKIFPLRNHDNLEMIFNHLLDVIGKHDVKLVDKNFSKDKEFGEAWYYGITKVNKNQMVIYLMMDPKKHLLEVNVNADDQEPITGLLAELEGQIREKLLMTKVIADGTTFNEINTSVLLGHCPYCNGPISPEWISLYKKGETIACKYCDTSIIPY